MPTLKQLSCHVEWSASGPSTPLNEYQTVYADGSVETFIAVPPIPTPFLIRLRSEGYIAPGLTMFVYINGEYQCNRGQTDLKAPSETGQKEHSNVEFVVRQKEESVASGQYLGKQWRFEELSAASEGVVQQDRECLGSIEVVVLRCFGVESSKAPKPSVSEKHPIAFVKREARPNAKPQKFSRTPHGSSRNTTSEPSNKRRSAYLFDGANDQSPSPHSFAPFGGDASWDNEVSKRMRYDTTGEAPRRSTRHDSKMAPAIIINVNHPASRYSSAAPWSPEKADWQPPRGLPGSGFGSSSSTHGSRGKGSLGTNNIPAGDSKAMAPYNGSGNSKTNRKGGTSDWNNAVGTPQNPNGGWAAERASHTHWGSGNDVPFQGYGTKDTHGFNGNSYGNSWENQANDGGGNWESGTNHGKRQDNWNSQMTNNNDNQVGTQVGQGDNTMAWGQPANTASGAQATAGNNDHSKSRATRSSIGKSAKSRESKRSKAASVASVTQNTGYKPPTLAKDNRANFTNACQPETVMPSSQAGMTAKVHDPGTNQLPCSSLPLQTIAHPNNIASANFQPHVQPGNPTVYQHKAASPKYMDTHEKPYAIFLFKYRSKAALEQMLNAPIPERNDISRLRRLNSLPKEALVEKIMRSKSLKSSKASVTLSSSSQSTAAPSLVNFRNTTHGGVGLGLSDSAFGNALTNKLTALAEKKSHHDSGGGNNSPWKPSPLGPPGRNDGFDQGPSPKPLLTSPAHGSRRTSTSRNKGKSHTSQRGATDNDPPVIGSVAAWIDKTQPGPSVSGHLPWEGNANIDSPKSHRHSSGRHETNSALHNQQSPHNSEHRAHLTRSFMACQAVPMQQTGGHKLVWPATPSTPL
ncbi:MAG: hypothetical protein Q9214_002132 [Letrouitia sp. 1 TL-2023]